MSQIILPPPLPLPEGHYDAFLFDCDGTLADTMPIYYRTWVEAMKEYNAHFPEETFYAWAGIPVARVIEMLNEQQGLNMPPEVISARREELMGPLMGSVKAITEVVAHVHANHGKIPMAVVSGSPRDAIQRTLTHIGIYDRFDVIVGCEDYTHGKPNPEPFLTAARRLGIAAEKCLVFEDADLGIQAAQAAGMAFVRVPGPLERAKKGRR